MKKCLLVFSLVSALAHGQIRVDLTNYQKGSGTTVVQQGNDLVLS